MKAYQMSEEWLRSVLRKRVSDPEQYLVLFVLGTQEARFTPNDLTQHYRLSQGDIDHLVDREVLQEIDVVEDDAVRISEYHDRRRNPKKYCEPEDVASLAPNIGELMERADSVYATIRIRRKRLLFDVLIPHMYLKSAATDGSYEKISVNDVIAVIERYPHLRSMYPSDRYAAVYRDLIGMGIRVRNRSEKETTAGKRRRQMLRQRILDPYFSRHSGAVELQTIKSLVESDPAVRGLYPKDSALYETIRRDVHRMRMPISRERRKSSKRQSKQIDLSQRIAERREKLLNDVILPNFGVQAATGLVQPDVIPVADVRRLVESNRELRRMYPGYLSSAVNHDIQTLGMKPLGGRKLDRKRIASRRELLHRKLKDRFGDVPDKLSLAEASQIVNDEPGLRGEYRSDVKSSVWKDLQRLNVDVSEGYEALTQRMRHAAAVRSDKYRSRLNALGAFMIEEFGKVNGTASAEIIERLSHRNDADGLNDGLRYYLTCSAGTLRKHVTVLRERSGDLEDKKAVNF